MSVSGHKPRPWRVGRKVGRTIYDANGELIGMMDTPEAALQACMAANFKHLVDAHHHYAPLVWCELILTDMLRAEQMALGN